MIELCCEYLSVRWIWMYVIIMSRTIFRVNLPSKIAWMSGNSLLEIHNIWSLNDTNRIQIHNHLVINKHSTIQPNWLNDWAVLWVFICRVHLTVCYYNVTNAFQNESTGYSCLNVKKLLAQNWHDIWSLCNSNRIKTHN